MFVAEFADIYGISFTGQERFAAMRLVNVSYGFCSAGFKNHVHFC